MTLENNLVQPPTQSRLNHTEPEISIIKSKIKCLRSVQQFCFHRGAGQKILKFKVRKEYTGVILTNEVSTFAVDFQQSHYLIPQISFTYNKCTGKYNWH